MNAQNSKDTELCVKDSCKKCDIPYIIKDFVKPLMQAMTVTLKEEYNMRLLTTKCLNTAVTFMYLFFGRDALLQTRYCDVDNTVERHKSRTDNNLSLALQLKKELLQDTPGASYVYYIMLTDGDFRKPDGDTVFFPGHVFLIEKIPVMRSNGPTMIYQLYQSYINQYDFNGYVENSTKRQLSKEKITYYLDTIIETISGNKWTQQTTDFWKDFAHVGADAFTDSVPEQAFYLCYRKVHHKHCVKHIKCFVKDVLKNIPRGPKVDDSIYGAPEQYDQKQSPLTNAQMRQQLVTFLKRIA